MILVYFAIGYKPNSFQWTMGGTILAGIVATAIILSLLIL